MAKKKETSLKDIVGGVGRSPLQAFGRADVTLVKGARLASYYSGGSSSTTAGEATAEDIDSALNPTKKQLEIMMGKEEEGMKKCIELGGEWDTVNKKCSKDGKSDTLKVEGKIDVGGKINIEGDGSGDTDPKKEGTTKDCECNGETTQIPIDDECCPEGGGAPTETVNCPGAELYPPTHKIENGECKKIETEEEKKEQEEKNTEKTEQNKSQKQTDAEYEAKLIPGLVAGSGYDGFKPTDQSGTQNIASSLPGFNSSFYNTVGGKMIASSLGAGEWKFKTNAIKGKGKNIDGWEFGKNSTYNGREFGGGWNVTSRDKIGNATEINLNIDFPRSVNGQKAFRNKNYSVSQLKTLYDNYQNDLTRVNEILEEAKGMNEKDAKAFIKKEIYSKGRTTNLGEEGNKAKNTLAMSMQLRAMGVFESMEFQALLYFNKQSVEKAGGKYREQSPLPMVFNSPFARRDMSFKRVRDKWRPNQQPTQPLTYTSPLHQEEFATETPEEQAGIAGTEIPTTLWDKIDDYGGMPVVNSTVENFVSNITYNPDFDKPLKAIQSGDHNRVIQEFADDLASQLKVVGKNKDMKGKQNVMTIADQLLRDINVFAEKFMSWVDLKGGDKTPGNIGGDMTSKGSDKTFDFNQSMIMMGDPDVNMGITPEGKIHFKRNDISGLVHIGDIDKGVFHKNYEGIKMFTQTQQRYHGNAIEGLPLNESQTEGVVSGILQTKDALLSWAHDENSGKSWVSEYSEMNQGEDLSWAMPESEQFDYDRLYDEVHGWMSHKLNEAYTSVIGAKAKKPEPDAAKQILSALQTPTQPQQPQQQEASPIAYKSRAQQLIEKYS